MERSEALSTIEREANRILGLAASPSVDRRARVAACPKWTLDDLLNHLGRVYSMVAAVLGDVTGGPPDRERLPRRQEGQDPGEWMRERFEIVLPMLAGISEDEARWNFLNGPEAPVSFWWRRQAHETVIHRVDAELAAGVPVSAIDPGIAADGIAELLLLSGVREVPWEDLELGHGLSVHLHATDEREAEWTIDTENGTFSAAHLKADVALRGPAFSLERWLYGRGSASPGSDGIPLSDLEAFGDVTAAERWRPAI